MMYNIQIYLFEMPAKMYYSGRICLSIIKIIIIIIIIIIYLNT